MHIKIQGSRFKIQGFCPTNNVSLGSIANSLVPQLKYAMDPATYIAHSTRIAQNSTRIIYKLSEIMSGDMLFKVK